MVNNENSGDDDVPKGRLRFSSHASPPISSGSSGSSRTSLFRAPSVVKNEGQGASGSNLKTDGHRTKPKMLIES